jgi:hypothetical protein
MSQSTNLTSVRFKIGQGTALDNVDKAFLVALHEAMERMFAVGIPAQTVAQATAAGELHDFMYGTPELNVDVELAPAEAEPSVPVETFESPAPETPVSPEPPVADEVVAAEASKRKPAAKG